MPQVLKQRCATTAETTDVVQVMSQPLAIRMLMILALDATFKVCHVAISVCLSDDSFKLCHIRKDIWCGFNGEAMNSACSLDTNMYDYLVTTYLLLPTTYLPTD